MLDLHVSPELVVKESPVCFPAIRKLSKISYDLWLIISDCNGIPTQDHLVRKRILNSTT